jgi:sulfide:quinone oxidoreductase
LSEDSWKKKGIRALCDIHYHTATPVIFPACLKFNDKLTQVVAEKNIEVHYNHAIKKVDKDSRKVTFVDENGKDIVSDFDFLHVVPPQAAPEFVSNSKLAAKSGYVDVDDFTMRHKKYLNVFSLGDASSCPTSKTAASTFA